MSTNQIRLDFFNYFSPNHVTQLTTGYFSIIKSLPSSNAKVLSLVIAWFRPDAFLTIDNMLWTCLKGILTFKIPTARSASGVCVQLLSEREPDAAEGEFIFILNSGS
jgi:hypothetical protein